jgi:homoserine kinase
MLKIRVPATSANLGPGFDCLGLAVDVWNEICFVPAESLEYRVVGEGEDAFNGKPKNLLTKAFLHLHAVCGKAAGGIAIRAENHILVGSGLGSSAAAILGGLIGANELLGRPLSVEALLKIAVEMEGHPDNAAAAMFGGLVVSVKDRDGILTRQYDVPPLTLVFVKPAVAWPTRMARSVLPRSVSRADAAYNIGRAALVVNALRDGDLDLLQKSMDDRVHQSYRLRHIPGGMAAYKKARQFGAAALSGAGPSIICFPPPDLAAQARDEIQKVFQNQRIEARSLITRTSNLGAHRA